MIVLLTIGGFCLSYAHLAEVAGQHGLGASPVRQWAWPATLDAFIVAGELLMLRAGLRRVSDPWAVTLTAVGSAGSIALNVAGVNGTAGQGEAPLLDYVVAAVPPAAALLAFGALMRQIHQLVDRPDTKTKTVPAPGDEPDLKPTTTNLQATAAASQPGTPADVLEEVVRGGRPASASVAEMAAIGREAAAARGKLTRTIVQQAIREAGHTVSGERLTTVMETLRSEPDPLTAQQPVTDR